MKYLDWVVILNKLSWIHKSDDGWMIREFDKQKFIGFGDPY